MIRRCLLFSLFLVVGLVFSPLSAGLAVEQNDQASISILESDETGFTVEFFFPNYSPDSVSYSGIEFLRITDPDLNKITTPGSPELPEEDLVFGLPPSGGYQISMLESESFSIHLQKAILPVETAVTSYDGDFPEVIYKRVEDKSIYQNDAYFPKEIVSGSPASVLRGHRIVNLQIYPFQYNPIRAELLWNKRILIRIDFDSPGEEFLDFKDLDNSPFDSALSQYLINYSSAKNWWSGQENNTSSLVTSLSGASIELVKLVVDQDGLYRVSYDGLISAGVQMSLIPFSSLGFSSQNQPVAIHPLDLDDDGIFESGDSFLFYGQKLDGEFLAEYFDQEDLWWNDYSNGWRPTFNATMVEKYTDENVYWIDLNGSAVFMEEIDGVPVNESLTPPEYFRSTIHAEQNNLWRTYHFNTEDTWFWSELKTSSSTYQEFQIDLPDIASTENDAFINGEVNAQANNPDVNPDHHTKISMNTGSLVEDATWDGKIAHPFSGVVNQENLLPGMNSLKFEVLTDIGQGSDDVLFNWYEVEYDRLFNAYEDELLFRSPREGETEFEVNDFSSLDIYALDISDPFAPIMIQNSEITSGKIIFQVLTNLDSWFYLVGGNKILTPKQISLYTGEDLHKSTLGADYIVIADPIFNEQSQRLIDYRSDQGLRTLLVSTEDIYNQFSFGIKLPAAIHAFLDFAYHHWRSPAPTYVVLIGDGHWNFKNFNPEKYGTSPIYMPPNLSWVDDIQGEVDSSSLLAAVDGDDPIPDIMIGRIPVNSLQELEAIVDKIIQYESMPIDPGKYPWQNQMIASAYFPDEAGDFPAEMDAFLEDYSSMGMSVQKVYLPDYPCVSGAACPEARDDLINGINAGASIVLYNGHGGVNGWGYSSRFLLNTDIASLTNQGAPSIVLSLTCLDGYWNYADKTDATTSLAETFLRKENGGAIAAFSPTGFGSSDEHDWLLRGFFDQLADSYGNNIGSAVLGAKLNLFGSGIDYSIINSYTIFGDPATQLRVPAVLHKQIYFPLVIN